MSNNGQDVQVEATEPQAISHGPDASRAEHLQWCKDRAYDYLPGDPSQAFASMMSDLRQHPELESHGAIELGGMLMMTPGWIDNARGVRDFINGFN